MMALLRVLGGTVRAAMCAGVLTLPGVVSAQQQRDPLVEAREMRSWVSRIQSAARSQSYSGTYVVMSQAGMMTSRITQICHGRDTLEQLELMDGARRTQIRHNDEVRTLLPDRKLAYVERRDALPSFPKLGQDGGFKLEQFYDLKRLGEDRVAGLRTSVVLMQPRDALRFGYKLWVDDKTGLLLKSQVIGPNGDVLEQVAFSEISFNPGPAQWDRIKADIRKADGYRQEQVTAVRTEAKAEGWHLRGDVPGYRELGCYKRIMQPEGAGDTRPRQVLQCVYSDGMANVSVFAEPYVPELHRKEGMMVMGAAHSLTLRKADGWITVLGEVPPAALKAFAASVERVQP
ncbi:MAG: MucB/RseB C-terminal domain-containing protein [Betaproteobacteria bacterium]|nr:MucB/RseB C-terminal domain-containing protein [Betaproteobacteria bacterium]